MVDLSLAGAVQLHYTAAPLFVGRPDPLPRRLLVLPGAEAVAVPPERLRTPPRRQAPPPAVPPADRSRYAYGALLGAVGRIGQAGEGSRHATILGEAKGLARLVRAGFLGEGEVREVLVAAGTAAGKPHDEIEKILAWSLDHPSEALVPQEAR